MAQLPERSRSWPVSSHVRRRLTACLVAFAGSTFAQAAGSWIPIGPNDVAMVSALSVGREALYAATCNGVYRSDDGGASWREAGLQRLCVIRLAADPRSDTIYAIANHNTFISLRPEPSHLLFVSFLGSTLWVSRDGARSWTQTPVGDAGAIAVDPTQPDTAYVASYDFNFYPLAVTRDTGTTWTRISEAPTTIFSQVDVDPRDGNLYAVGPGTLAVRSAGVWTETSLPAGAVGLGSDSNGSVYLAGFQSLCRKTNAEPDWACSLQSWSTAHDVIEIPATPTEAPTVLVVSFEGVWVSSDGGTRFSLAAGDPAGYTPAVALDPARSAVYAGNDLGVYRSVDRGRSWTSSSVGLRSSWIRALAIDPLDSTTIWAGAEGRPWDVGQPVPGLFRSSGAGNSWTRVSEGGEPGFVFSLVVSTADPRRVHAASLLSVTNTDDGGASWSTSDPSTGLIYGIASDPGSASTVWAATDEGLKKSADGGGTWSDDLASAVYGVLFDSRRPGTIYAGSSWYEPDFYYPFGWGFAVETSRDNGATWTRAGTEDGGAAITLAIDPFSDDVVYAGTYARTIVRSPDAGATWEQWDVQGSGHWAWALVADPARSGTLYQGGWGGVFRSIDGGRSWHEFSEGLAPYGVFGLAVSRDGAFLYAGTTGGGVFRRNLLAESRQPVRTIDRPRTTRTVPP